MKPTIQQYDFWLVLTRKGVRRWELYLSGVGAFQFPIFVTRREARLWVRKTGLNIYRIVRCRVAYRA